jgi:protein-tyrosine phosphatase
MKKILKPNNSVVIHCHAGLGRTGLLAATFLVSMGLAAESAIKTIRETRPGSIETIEQEKYIKEWNFRFE